MCTSENYGVAGPLVSNQARAKHCTGPYASLVAMQPLILEVLGCSHSHVKSESIASHWGQPHLGRSAFRPRYQPLHSHPSPDGRTPQFGERRPKRFCDSHLDRLTLHFDQDDLPVLVDEALPLSYHCLNMRQDLETIASLEFGKAVEWITKELQEKRKIRSIAVVLWALSLILGVPFTSTASPSKFKTIDVPLPGVIETSLNGINRQGDIVGEYRDSLGHFHGFLLTHGTFTYIDVPGANLTEAIGINSRDDIVGDYVDSQGFHGFLLSDGKFTTIDAPGSIFTVATGISTRGDIVGLGAAGGGFHLSNGTYTSIVVPGASGTLAWGISPRGNIVMGFELDSTLVSHIFLLNNGTFTYTDVPGANLTEARGINSQGDIVGDYFAKRHSMLTEHGFLLRQGTFTPIDVHGANTTAATGINSQGDIVGWYRVSSHGISHIHGFLLSKESRSDHKDTEPSDEEEFIGRYPLVTKVVQPKTENLSSRYLIDQLPSCAR